MKIGLVVPGFSANERDWCIPALLNLVRRLAVNHSVYVFALEYPYRRDRYSVYDATVYSMNGRNRGKAYAPRLWSDTLAAIRAEHRRAPFDLLHAFWANEPGAIAMVAGRAMKIPVVVSVAGGELVGLGQINYGGQLRWIERTMVNWTMRSANRVTVGSRYLQTIAARWRNDVCLLPLGVDANLFSPSAHRKPNVTTQDVISSGARNRVNAVRDFLQKPLEMTQAEQPQRQDALTILNVGSLAPVKNQIQLLNTFAQLNRPDLCFEIIGTGKLENELRAKATALGLADRVTFVGAILHDALATRYRQANLFVQSSLHEAQGMAVLEAAACAIPIAGTPVGVLPELANAGGAVVANGFQADDLAETIRNALQLHDQLGDNARRVVEQNFSMEQTWNGWIKLYQAQLD